MAFRQLARAGVHCQRNSGLVRLLTPLRTMQRVRCFSAASVSIAQVRSLRERTGSPLKEVKDALTAAAADLQEGENLEEKALELLRKKGISTAAKKAGRATAQGVVALNASEKSGTLVEVNSETDFVSRNDHFQKLVVAVSHVVDSVAIEPATASGALPLSLSALMDASLNGAKVSDAVTQLVATVRENVQVRRAVKVQAQSAGGVVGAYMHNVLPPAEGVDVQGTSFGRVGSLVALETAAGPEHKAELQELAKKLAMHVVAFNPRYMTREAVPAEVVQKEKEIITEKAANEGKGGPHMDRLVTGRLNKYFEEVVLLDQVFLTLDPTGKPPSVGAHLKALSETLKTPVSISAYIRYQCGEGIEIKQVAFADEVKAKMGSA